MKVRNMFRRGPDNTPSDMYLSYIGVNPGRGASIAAGAWSDELPADRFYDKQLQRDYKDGWLDLKFTERDLAILGDAVGDIAVDSPEPVKAEEPETVEPVKEEEPAQESEDTAPIQVEEPVQAEPEKSNDGESVVTDNESVDEISEGKTVEPVTDTKEAATEPVDTASPAKTDGKPRKGRRKTGNKARKPTSLKDLQAQNSGN